LDKQDLRNKCRFNSTTTSSVIGTAPSSPYAVSPFNKYGVTFPLEDKHVLNATEVAEVTTATTKSILFLV
jgi:hypothetical protein